MKSPRNGTKLYGTPQQCESTPQWWFNIDQFTISITTQQTLQPYTHNYT